MSTAAYALLGLMIFELGLVLAQHGKPRGPYSFWSHLVSVGVLLAILHWGGFFARGAA